MPVALAESGELAKLLKLIAEIGKDHPEFAGELRALAESFHYDRLIGIIRTEEPPREHT